MTRIHLAAAWAVSYATDLKADVKHWWARLAYRGLHRPGVDRPEMLGWLEAHRLRAAAWLREHAQPVLLDFDHERVVEALREPTLGMIVPDFDSDVDNYDNVAGSAHYTLLSPARLDVEADREIKQLVVAA